MSEVSLSKSFMNNFEDGISAAVYGTVQAFPVFPVVWTMVGELGTFLRILPLASRRSELVSLQIK